eukprot:8483324-Pyramimonas_sp.AAC.1
MWRKLRGAIYASEATRCRLRGVSFAAQAMWRKLWVARDVAQAMWMKTARRNLRGAIYAVRVLLRKLCGA